MRRIVMTLALAAALGSGPASGDPGAQGGDRPVGASAPPAPATLSVSNARPRPGEPVLVEVRGMDKRPRGVAGKQRLVFFETARGWQAIAAVPLDDAPPAAAPGGPPSPPTDAPAATIEVKVDGTDLRETLTVAPHRFPEEDVDIDAELAAPSPSQAREISADNAAVLAALRNDEPPLFAGKFRAPAGKRTSPFGAWRRFNDDPHRSRHLGMDVASRKGAPIRAIERGKVTLVRAGLLTGGTVVLVHGAGLASAYFHVGDFAVKPGEIVERGAVLGKVGLTGRTTGPHIHIGMWAGAFVDPAAFFKLKIGAPSSPPAAEASPPADRR